MTDWTDVRTAIADAEQGACTIGLSVITPDGSRFAHNGGRRFTAASTVKIAIMIELFRRIDAGEMRLDDPHVLTAEDKATGGGIILHLHPGLNFTLGDIVYLMMSISDNTATNILIALLGMDRINATMQSLGMADSCLGRIMRGRPVRADEQENWAVPDEYAALIASLLAGSAASAGSCTAMIALLEKQQNDRRIARHLPRADRPRWGSKTGSLPGVVNDVGFIMTPRGPLILAVFVAEPPDPLAGEAIIGALARAALLATG